MKQLLLLILVMPLVAGCSRTKAIEFCEGISPEGKGVNCGTEFYQGELLAIITGSEPFGVNTIAVQVSDAASKGAAPIESITVDVKPDRERATANLSLYAGGTYRVKALKKDTTIGEAEIVIRERR